MATIKFIVKGKGAGKDREYLKNSKGESLIYCQITGDDGTKANNYYYRLISTKIKIKEPKNTWDPKTGTPIPSKKNPAHARVKSELLSFEESIKDIIRELGKGGIYPTPDAIRDRYISIKDEGRPETALSQSFVYLWKQQTEHKRVRKKNPIRDRTYTSIIACIDTFDAFTFSQNKAGIKPDQITLQTVNDFESFMEYDREYKHNTISRRLKRLKEALSNCKRDGHNIKFDLSRIEFGEVAGPKVYLTESELNDLETLELTGLNEHVRDLFVLQCYIGLRISDLRRLDQSIDGNRIRLTTQKTGAQIDLPITPAMRQILERYNYTLPKVADQVVNRYLKAIFKRSCPGSIVQVRGSDGNIQNVPKWKLLSSHDAIRTFVMLSAERGMNITAIAQVVGKSVQVLMKNYWSESRPLAEKEFQKAWDISPLKKAE